jgi:hypothetical protein
LAGIRKKDSPAIEFTQPSQGSRGLRIAALVCVAGVWAWVLLGANNALLAEASWKNALVVEQSLMEKNWQAGDEEYIDLISNAAAAASYQPGNVKYQHWLNVYRWKSISRLTDPQTGEVIVPEMAMDTVQRIVDELHKARLLCPTYGATYSVVGQLEKSALNDPRGAEHIRKGFQLAPCDPTACFIAGSLDAEEQQIDAAFDKFSRAVELDGRFFINVADLYINHLNRPDLALAIAGDNISWLSYVNDAIVKSDECCDIVGSEESRAP